MKRQKLGDICSRLSSGKSIKAAEIKDSGSYPVIGGNGLRGYTENFNFDGSCAVIGRQGAACGNVRFHSGKAYMTEHAVVAVANECNDSRYLAYFLSTMHLGHLSAQSAQPGLSVKTLSKQEIDLPSLEIQKQVVKLLGTLDDKIEANAKLNGYLAEYLKSCAKRLYREYERDEEADLPEGWHWTTIGEISEMVCRGITPKYNDESDELILGQTCIRNNLVLLENGRLHAPRKITEKWLKKYDLLINSTGVGSLGRTAQVWFDPSKLVVDSHVTIVRAADPRHALYMGFWAFEHERYIESLHTGSTGQTELPRDHVKAIRLVLPSDAELEKFNAVAQPAVELIVANQKESKRLAELRDTFLPKLMSGEIDVSSVTI